MNLTIDEIKLLVSLIDVGIKASGIQITMNKGGVVLQSIIDKLDAEIKKEQEKNGDSNS